MHCIEILEELKFEGKFDDLKRLVSREIENPGTLYNVHSITTLPQTSKKGALPVLKGSLPVLKICSDH